MRNIIITIPEFCLITLAAFIGILFGMFIALLIVKQGWKQVFHRKKRKSLNRIKNDSNEDPSAIHTPQTTSPNDDFTTDHPDIFESKYTEGSILEQKLKRDGVSMFDLNCAADGEAPEERVRARQGNEDKSYEVLKSDKDRT